jgi:UDP-N-acetylmuramate: L-alanyl-gamma-D-glutamyl-meso-diaminopimelate ligase
MSTLLQEAGIEPLLGFDPSHLDPPPDLVIVGNAVPRTNPEAEEVERRGLEKLSMPEALARYLLHDRLPLVISGTHGKTTTTSLAAWVWDDCGAEPGFLIGGIPQNLGTGFRLGHGPRFIIEGDEYNAAYFDRGPKFLHYRAQTLILTGIEFDHADLYADEEETSAAFQRLLAALPETGLLVACGDSPSVRRIAHLAPCRTVFYGLGDDNDVRPVRPLHQDESGLTMTVDDAEDGEVDLFLPMHGEHNAANALAVWAAARADGIPTTAIAAAMQQFAGVKRRAEILGMPGGIAIVDDFAHHPTAVRVTLRGLRARFPTSRLVAVFEPRSLTTAQNFFFEDYCQAFAEADVVYFAPIFHAQRFDEGKRLDLGSIAKFLESRQIATFLAASIDEIRRTLPARLEPGDVVVTMSSGSLEGLPRALLQATEERFATAEPPAS